MDHEIQQTSRWAHWTLGLLAAAILLGFGWMLLGGVRVLIPPYLLSSYWLLAAIINRKTVVLNASGLQITVGPIPVRKRLHFEHGDLRCCYVRHVINVNEDGVEGRRFYMAGVESRSGFQFPLDGPFEEQKQAWEAAHRLAAAANRGRHERLLPVETREHFPHVPPVNKLRVLMWTAAFLVALLLGVVWETAR